MPGLKNIFFHLPVIVADYFLLVSDNLFISFSPPAKITLVVITFIQSGINFTQTNLPETINCIAFDDYTNKKNTAGRSP